MEVEDLLHQHHCRFVRGVRDHERRPGEHQRGDREQRHKDFLHGVSFLPFQPFPAPDDPYPACPARQAWMFEPLMAAYSVMSGSNIQRHIVIATASKVATMEIHIVAIASSGAADSNAEVP